MGTRVTQQTENRGPGLLSLWTFHTFPWVLPQLALLGKRSPSLYWPEWVLAISTLGCPEMDWRLELTPHARQMSVCPLLPKGDYLS